MSVPVVFRRRFQNDLAAGYDWYNGQRAGLGEELVTAVVSTLGSVQTYAEMFAPVHREVRRAMVARFPFAIFYLVEPHRLVALRMLHTARDPKLWPRARG